MKKSHCPPKPFLFNLIFACFLCTFMLTPAAADECSWGAPMNLRDSLRGATTMIINWDAPAQGVPPGGYQVTLNIVNIVGIVNQTVVYDNSIKFENLTPGTHYQIEIKSICENGQTGPASLIGLPTIIVELVANGDLFCTQPGIPPLPSISDYVNNNVPFCNSGGFNPYCAGVWYDFPDISANAIQICNYRIHKNDNANRFCWFVVERDIDANGITHYRIKKRDSNFGVTVSLESNNYLVIKIDNYSIANVGLYNDQFHFTKMYSGNPKVTGVCDFYAECFQVGPLPYVVHDEASNDLLSNKPSILLNNIETSNSSHNDIQCIPNPANNNITLYYHKAINENTSIYIFDNNGSLINVHSFTGYHPNETHIETFDIGNLSSGQYWIIVRDEVNSVHSSFIKL